MENAAEALQMGAWVLIFVLAVSICISSFGEARSTSQMVVDYNDREYDYTYVENNGTTKRVVSGETIIPTIYNAFQENYKIVFENSNGIFPDGIYKKDGQPQYEISTINLVKSFGLSLEQRKAFIEGVLYGRISARTKYPEGLSSLELPTVSGRAKINLNSVGLYDIIKGYKFEESTGVYYEQEVDGTEVPEANKEKRRVITYRKTP